MHPFLDPILVPSSPCSVPSLFPVPPSANPVTRLRSSIHQDRESTRERRPILREKHIDTRSCSISADDPTEPLHRRQHNVSLLNHCLVERVLAPVLALLPVRLDDSVHSVDRAAQPPCGNEPRQITVEEYTLVTDVRERERDVRIHEFLSYSERIAEVLHRDAAVRLQQLCVGLDAHFAHVVASVHGEQSGGNEVVFFHNGWGTSRSVPGAEDKERETHRVP